MVRTSLCFAAAFACFLPSTISRAQDLPPVGPIGDNAHVVPTAQFIRPAGESIELAGRPVDLVLSPDGRTLYVKHNRGVLVIDAAAWQERQNLAFQSGGASMCGIAVTPDGKHVYVTTTANTLAEAEVGPDGTIAWQRAIELPGPKGKGASFPCGVVLSPDGKRAFVCLSRNNTLGVVDLDGGALERQIDVGVAPTAVAISPDGGQAYVTNWGGRRAKETDKTATSAGTPAVIDERGVAASGTVSIVDLAGGREVAQVAVGLSPAAITVSADGGTVFVANANADTVSCIDTARRDVVQTISTRPNEQLPFGSMPNGLALSADGQTLFVSNAGNNAIAVVSLADGLDKARIEGLIPTAWYPANIVTNNGTLYVVNIKGVGSRTPNAKQEGWNSHWHRGTVSKIVMPDEKTLAKYTAQAERDARVPQVLTALERATRRNEVKPVPVPAHPGEPSVFEHVVYVIKENRTYDQVFGDIPRGNHDSNLCVFGREITPNHHAMAEQFVLLDNYYCNGVLSADGHSWATEGNVTPYLERSFGGFARSYTFGDDPLTYSSSGFIWDHVLAAGLSFRNYGEFDRAREKPDGDFVAMYEDLQEGTGKFSFVQNIGVERLRHYSCPNYPGWNLEIPDVVRADRFLREFREFEKNGEFPNFVIVYLPNDHTSGTSSGQPTPRAMVADNDLALGRIVEAVSHSRFWPKTCIFVIEDDPQNGFDHVDGHRSLCLVVSPYTKRGALVSEFYNQSGVVHTIERILGLPAPNQLAALAPLMSDCFTTTPDVAPFTCLPNNVQLTELNAQAEDLSAEQRRWAALSAELPLKQPDAADEDTLNRILWHAMKGVDARYPAELAGPHGRGLDALGLRHAPFGLYEADDDDGDS